MKNRKASATMMGCFLFACILFLCAATAALAQAGRGSIGGLVTDPTGAIVPGANITATNHATGVALHTVTTTAGLYGFVALNPGAYKVTASMKGFESVAQDNVNVTVDQVSTVNITLRVGNVSTVVTVTESANLMETSNSTVGQLISAETIDRVPLLTRNVFDLVQLSAGVTPANGSPNSSSSYAITNISSGRPGIDVASYTVNGAIEGSLYYMLDGSPLGVAEQNVAAVLPAMEIPEDGVDEYRVETQNTPASYQSGGAGVISLVSKSGGDRFHGDVFGVFRPDILAANEFFNKQYDLSQGLPNTPQAFHRYQEGGAIGGPILHKKLFFFADYEATQQQQYDGSNQFTVPTTPERTGDFSGDTATPIYDPRLIDQGGNRQQVGSNGGALNVITSPNPIAEKFLSMLPACNIPDPTSCQTDTGNHLNNFFKPGLDPTTAQRFDVRMDYYKGDKQRIFGRFSFDRLFNSSFNAYGNAWDEDYAQNITNGRNFIIGDDYTLNATTVLQLRYSFTRHHENQGGDPGQSAVDDLGTLGFTSPTSAEEAYKTLPYVFFTDLSNTLGNDPGVGGTANYNTFLYTSQNHDAIATVTKSWGKHEISAGFEYMKRFLNDGQPGAPSGAYNFDVTASDQNTGATQSVGGSDFASFLLGLGSTNESTNFTQDIFVAEASPYYAGFAEDTYHASKALTVTLGLRWDIFGGKTERHNRLEYFDPTATYTAAGYPGTLTGGEVFASNGNRSPFTTNMKDLGPRLGFSWQPVNHLVVHGGAGFYFGPSAEMVGSPSLDSDGYAKFTNWNATCVNADGNSVYNGVAECNGASTALPASSTTGPYSFSNPFPTGLLPPSQIQPNGLQTNLGSNLNTMLHSQRTVETYNFNFGVEYELPHAFVVSAGYVGSRGLFLPLAEVDLNQLPLSTIASLGAAGANSGQFLAAEPFPQFNSGGISETGQTYGVMVHGYPAGDSEYSSLQTKVQKRLTQHFTTLASFTWAKLMTDDGTPPLSFVGSHAGAIQDWKNMNFEHSVSPQDVKYQFTWDASYDLPVGKGRALNLNGVSNIILGNWTADAVLYLSDGIPITSPGVSTAPVYLDQRTDMICNPSKGAPHTYQQWFSSACFVPPGSEQGSPNPYIAGNAPAYLDGVRAMGADDLDFTLSKNFKLGGERDLHISVSSYNVANRAQFSAPSVPAFSTGYQGFGSIGSTVNSPRQFQGGARFTF
ncbi:MAG: TonB-dependent receptor [Terracidiphilus sp.]